jgi:hypothetical protein
VKHLNRLPALFFSVVGVALLLGVSLAISYRRPGLALLAAAASVLFIGWGFAVKARNRRRNER